MTALALGAAAGLKSIAAQAVKDAYTGLKALILRKYSNQGNTAQAVEGLESKPDSNGRRETLKEELIAGKADQDQEVVDQATDLLQKLENGLPGVTGGLVGQINAAGGKVTVVGGNVGQIIM
ncbi:MAG: hypothetical protein QME81_06565 [bacterium]|nr:hypothetical protein [bacterium]